MQSSQLINDVLYIYNTTEGWILESEKTLNDSDTSKTSMFTRKFESFGKFFKLVSYLPFNDRFILRVLRDQVDNFNKWNTTINTSKVVKQISKSTNVVYVLTHPVGPVAARYLYFIQI